MSGITPTPQELANVAAAAAGIQAHADHVNTPGHDIRTCEDPRCQPDRWRAIEAASR